MPQSMACDTFVEGWESVVTGIWMWGKEKFKFKLRVQVGVTQGVDLRRMYVVCCVGVSHTTQGGVSLIRF